MGREGNIYETYDEFMDAEGHRDWPSIAVYFYRDEWIMGILSINRPYLKRFISISTIRLSLWSVWLESARRHSEYEVVHEPSLKGYIPLDVLINTCKFSFQSLGAQTSEELKLQGVPIVQGYTIYMDEKS